MTVKISELAEATLPLSGAEQVLVVQAGVTKRAVSSALPRLIFSGIITQGSLGTGQSDDLVIDGDMGENARVHLSATADSATVTGIDGGAEGFLLVLTNISAFIVTLMAEHTDSAAENRLAMNGDHILLPRCSVWFLYDSTVSRWTRIS